jgi:hypothetical protein
MASYLVKNRDNLPERWWNVCIQGHTNYGALVTAVDVSHGQISITEALLTVWLTH